VIGKRYGRFRLQKFSWISIGSGLLVAFLLCGCTGNGNASIATSLTPSGSPSQSPVTPLPSGAVAALCGDFAKIQSRLPPLLARLSSDQESKPRYQRDQVVIAELTQSLYADASSFALAGQEDVFELANRLSAHLNRLVYGYFMYEVPSQIEPAVIPLVRQDLDDVSSQLNAGLLRCP
jgi:hypothetical protein